MGAATRAMQDDDTTNPAIFWVLEGEALWREKAGRSERSCADCHGDATTRMRGVAARYPAWDGTAKQLLNIEGRIRQCRTERQQADAFAPESRPLLSLAAYLGRQSRGLPIAIALPPAANPSLERGRALFQRRQGQLDLSCAHCHDTYAGRSLAGNTIPQGHPTAYPLYRLEWQTLGSLTRRLRNCMTGMRAEPWAPGAAEWVELELYLMWRANGMLMETPGVRP
jgi:sulfur-oxidizing protein SoxA